MKFWIVTPSYNQLEWLKLCIASVADQAGDSIEVHHHVQDACSTDGTQKYLAEYLESSKQKKNNGYSFSYESEKDEGMYDAINRGWKLAPNEIDVIAHLNCDEQYLPNALETIAGFMKSHSKTDVVLADMIVIDKDGEYICHRRSLKPQAFLSRYCCAAFTATTFQRATVTKDKKVFFDTSWRNFGDKVWYNALHQAKCRFSVCHDLVSVFTDTGENLNWTDEGKIEKSRYETEYLNGRSLGVEVVSKINGLLRFLVNCMLPVPSQYSIFRDSPTIRTTITISNPTTRWGKRFGKNT